MLSNGEDCKQSTRRRYYWHCLPYSNVHLVHVFSVTRTLDSLDARSWSRQGRWVVFNDDRRHDSAEEVVRRKGGRKGGPHDSHASCAVVEYCRTQVRLLMLSLANRRGCDTITSAHCWPAARQVRRAQPSRQKSFLSPALMNIDGGKRLLGGYLVSMSTTIMYCEIREESLRIDFPPSRASYSLYHLNYFLIEHLKHFSTTKLSIKSKQLFRLSRLLHL